MFAQLPEAPIDPILGMAQAFARDPSPDKVDLGIGIYKDEHGEVIVLPTVKAAERALVEGQSTKRYLSSAGNPEYNERTRGLLFREGSDAHARARTIQTVGGTGALRVAADFIGKFGTGKRIFLPDPTWANPPAIFGVAGFEIVNYPYYDIATGTLKLDEMMSALADLRAGDTVLLHGCCHNPSGADPSAAQWAEIADAVARSGATPRVDLAYLGFAEGLEEDRQGLAILAERLPEMIVASSCSKNFALYRERTGALTVVGANPGQADTALAIGLRTRIVRPQACEQFGIDVVLGAVRVDVGAREKRGNERRTVMRGHGPQLVDVSIAARKNRSRRRNGVEIGGKHMPAVRCVDHQRQAPPQAPLWRFHKISALGDLTGHAVSSRASGTSVREFP